MALTATLDAEGPRSGARSRVRLHPGWREGLRRREVVCFLGVPYADDQELRAAADPDGGRFPPDRRDDPRGAPRPPRDPRRPTVEALVVRRPFHDGDRPASTVDGLADDWCEWARSRLGPRVQPASSLLGTQHRP